MNLRQEYKAFNGFYLTINQFLNRNQSYMIAVESKNIFAVNNEFTNLLFKGELQ
jgi:hypothetical protein